MKKLIAIFAALSMVASIGITTVLADEPTDLTITCDVQELNADEYEEVFGEAAGDNVGFSLTFAIEGLEDDLSWTQKGTGSSRTYKGRSIAAAGLTLKSDISNDNLVAAFASEDAALSTENDIVATTFNGLTMERFNDAGKLLPSAKSTAFDGSDFIIFFVAIPKGIEMNLTPEGTIQIANFNDTKGVDTTDVYSNETNTNLYFDPAVITLSSGSPTTPVTGVSLDKEALSFKVGDAAQQLTATVAPDDATDKSVSWSSDNTSVATVSDGLVTAVGVGTATIKVTTTDGGKTATCAVEVKAADVVIPSAETVAAVDKDNITKEYTDLQGNPVTSFNKNYGIAKFSTALDTAAKNYFIDVTDTDGNDKSFAVDFDAKGVELSSTSDFYAIVKSATHVIKTIVLRAVAK